MPTYILDILIESGDLYQACSSIKTPIWILIRADGLHQSFATSQVAPCPHPVWNCPARLVINLPTLEGSHFKATLCTSVYTGQVVPVASSQIRLSVLPCGTPSRLAFPLLNTGDYREPIGQLTAKVSLLMLPPQPPPEPPAPDPSIWPHPRTGIPARPGPQSHMPPQSQYGAQTQMGPPAGPFFGYPGTIMARGVQSGQGFSGGARK
jgi:hypothetical protein